MIHGTPECQVSVLTPGRSGSLAVTMAPKESLKHGAARGVGEISLVVMNGMQWIRHANGPPLLNDPMRDDQEMVNQEILLVVMH